MKGIIERVSTQGVNLLYDILQLHKSLSLPTHSIYSRNVNFIYRTVFCTAMDSPPSNIDKPWRWINKRHALTWITITWSRGWYLHAISTADLSSESQGPCYLRSLLGKICQVHRRYVESIKGALNNLTCQFKVPMDLPAPFLFTYLIFSPLNSSWEKIFFLQSMASNFR